VRDQCSEVTNIYVPSGPASHRSASAIADLIALWDR